MRYVQKISKFKQVIIQMDTTYWGRNFGLMVIKDALRKKILWRKYVSALLKWHRSRNFSTKSRKFRHKKCLLHM